MPLSAGSRRLIPLPPGPRGVLPSSTSSSSGGRAAISSLPNSRGEELSSAGVNSNSSLLSSSTGLCCVFFSERFGLAGLFTSRSASDSSKGESFGSCGAAGLPGAAVRGGFLLEGGFDGGPTSASRSISSVTRASSLPFLSPGLECSRRMSLSEADLGREGPNPTASSCSRTILTSLSGSSSIGTICTLLSGEESLLGRLPGGPRVLGFLDWEGLSVLGLRVETVGALGVTGSSSRGTSKSTSRPSGTRRTSLSLPGLGAGERCFLPLLGGPLLLLVPEPGGGSWPISTWSLSSRLRLNSNSSSASGGLEPFLGGGELLFLGGGTSPSCNSGSLPRPSERASSWISWERKRRVPRSRKARSFFSSANCLTSSGVMCS